MAQKTKVKWSIEWDENTSFFHGMLNKTRSLLNIRGIMVDGMWIESPNRVKVELESDVSNEDIKRAVWDFGIDKSPGPDGFTFGFYRRFWNLIENDVYDAAKYFFTYGVIPKRCNSSFIALIPKIPDANTGDPLSPFLFILIMESLHLSFQWVVDAGIFKGIKLSSSLSISHMFYADDTVFLGQWCDGNITTLPSGLRINMSKSKIMGVLVDSDKVKYAASKLGCLILKTPFSYLGSKVGGSMSRVHTWNEVLDRVKNRLSKWKMKTLSIRGNGDKTTFWEDIWIEGKALKNRYPRIYSLETCKLITVGMKLAQTSLDSSFRRVTRSGVEQEQFDELSALVHDVTLTPIQTVRMITRWWDVPYGEFDSYEDWINWFVNLRLSYKHKQMLEDVFYVK
nr:RNA-directed DNA polymerase, eukaryota, reverse transcriptase zinc-binding domain protein [Tanacetum cinerariifolium]